jgi:hypothetical protein
MQMFKHNDGLIKIKRKRLLFKCLCYRRVLVPCNAGHRIHSPLCSLLLRTTSTTDKAIDIVKDQYRVYAKSVAHGNAYLVDHSTYVYLLDREGKFIKHIPHDMSPADMKRVFVDLLTKKNEVRK